jgi:hypothetical protein
VNDGMDMASLPETKGIGLLKRAAEDRVQVIHRFFIWRNEREWIDG